MKAKQAFKDIKKPAEIDGKELNTYLRAFYNDPLFDVKDASYVDDPEQEFYKKSLIFILFNIPPIVYFKPTLN